jgi:hypothetical protein
MHTPTADGKIACSPAKLAGMEPFDFAALVLITCAHIDDQERFDQQKDAVKATGATFHKQPGQWTLEIDQLDPAAGAVLTTLFRIAAEYGTDVKVIVPRTPAAPAN